MKNRSTTRFILRTAIITTSVFFLIGTFFAYREGFTWYSFARTIYDNVRRLDVSPVLSEFIPKNDSFRVPLENSEKIVINSSFASVQVFFSEVPDINISMDGTLKSEISRNPIKASIDEDGTMNINVVNQQVANPTTTGFMGIITIPNSFKGEVIIRSESGNISFNSSRSENKVDIASISGLVSLSTGGESDLKVRTDSGNIQLDGGTETNVDFSTVSGSVNIQTMIYLGNVVSESGYIHVESSTMGGNSRIATKSGEVEIFIENGYTYDVKSDTGQIRYKGEVRLSPVKGIHETETKTLTIETESGNVSLN